MALRLPAHTGRLGASRIALCTRVPPPAPSTSPSPLLRSQLLPIPNPTAVTRSIRLISTTTRRPWLLSALPNLAPGANNSPTPPKTIRARRLLPYSPAQVYTLIADIDSYTHFLPHCPHSRVTKWTTAPKEPSNTNTLTRHPALADLTVGWGPFTQTYTSRVYCVPGEMVEAVSGSADTSIPRDVLRSVGYEFDDTDKNVTATTKMEGIFESLVTRWTVKPVAAGPSPSSGDLEGRGGWTEVTLSVTFQFANPALGFAVGQLADEKVDEMVEAFEGRARQLYGR
ncbi:dehydrase and lipid transport-domain-containing protein [Corynascus similis CBS 632.67]